MELISGYMQNGDCRRMLNELTVKTFGFDFEEWVGAGYFEGDYLPYSLVHEGKIISNVSVNRMSFMRGGALKNYIQLGTVMTDESFRGQGLAARLMRHVIGEYEDKCGGIYLFGNLNAGGFYRKLGFDVTNQYRYYVKDEFCRESGDLLEPVKPMGAEMKQKYLDAVRTGRERSSFEQINRYGLQMFYTAGLDNVYYARDLDCFVVLSQNDDCVVVQSILGDGKAALAEVVRRVDTGGRKCRLGFTPLDEDKEICAAEMYDGGDDYRLFCMGGELGAVEADKLYFPELSHA